MSRKLTDLKEGEEGIILSDSENSQSEDDEEVKQEELAEEAQPEAEEQPEVA